MHQYIPDHLQHNAYCDGGCIVKNPSSLGGSWAWCLVDQKGEILEYDSGIIKPQDFGLDKITNNLAELYAALQAIDAQPKGWHGLLYSDSLVTIYRLSSSIRFNGIPKLLREKCLNLRRNKLWTPMHIAGHPTKADLEAGYNVKGLPVSIHNQWCDTECRRQANLFMKRLKRKRAS